MPQMLWFGIKLIRLDHAHVAFISWHCWVPILQGNRKCFLRGRHLHQALKNQYQLARQMGVKEKNSGWLMPKPMLITAKLRNLAEDIFCFVSISRRDFTKRTSVPKAPISLKSTKTVCSTNGKTGRDRGKNRNSYSWRDGSNPGRVQHVLLTLASRRQCRALGGVVRLHSGWEGP